ncbi:hypothetical protein ACFL02_07610, partial [Planctomycetota bacterium]
MSFDFRHSVWRGIIGTLIVLIMVQNAEADKITLTNGNSLTGKVISLSSGQLIFDSGQLGQLTIDMGHIRSIQTESSLPILLAENEKPLQARILSAAKGVYLTNPDQQLLIDPNDIVALGDAVQKIIQGPDKTAQWSGDVELGLSGRSG